MEKTKAKYAFFNSGSYYLFRPEKVVHDIRNGSSETALKFHINLAKEVNRSDCFILDDKGELFSYPVGE